MNSACGTVHAQSDEPTIEDAKDDDDDDDDDEDEDDVLDGADGQGEGLLSTTLANVY